MSQPFSAQVLGGKSSSPSYLYALAAAAGIGIVGYSFYFDHKRRSQPDYKQKIREKRKQKQEAARNDHPDRVEFPNMQDREAMEAFFFDQIQRGEELMNEDPERGTFHLANAVVSCYQGTELLGIFQQTLPPEHFNMLIQAVPQAKMRLQATMAARIQNGGFGAAFLRNAAGGGGDGDEGVVLNEVGDDAANALRGLEGGPQGAAALNFNVDDELE